ncbi:GH92 family glycosyl hydrolase [Phaeodactylibacter luteus]|uniref:Glycoside hydrolase family 92 protein n=1 Tax=Phaeodactylibacter luteus TaxID=1564516 RepID=A0A5C6RWR3_9BACT|nr:GH92 family glycosyl hydrolase [Phaeodactylibacter luteus]TXB66514.1 glycoside hydrolase family 92 protein [Phaeodactylibacter luteus]
MHHQFYLNTLLLLFSVSTALAQKPADWVNPFIGTSNFGATHPGPQYPHGLASVAPFNTAFSAGGLNPTEKDEAWNSRGYVHENKFLTGFSHANLSGVGCPELGTPLLMPTAGARSFDPQVYGSVFSAEDAEAGYYSCHLDKHNIKVEASSTLRTGLSRYTFPGGEGHILLNLGLALSNESGGMVSIVDAQEVEGFRMVGTFCYNPEDVRPIYFVARISKAAEEFGPYKKMPAYRNVEADWVAYNNTWKPYPYFQQEVAGDDVGAYFSFQTVPGEVIEVKLGISFVSIANARQNLNAEQPGFDFERVRTQNYERWNELLGRAEVEGTDYQKELFYTALYHSLVHPSIFQDVNGEYPLMGQHGAGRITTGNRYTVYSLWDTYRNVHPLLSLLYPEIQEDMVRSMTSMSEESGWLPKWELLGMETGVMVGDPATPVIADTYLRGLRNFNVEAAYQAARRAATAPETENPLRPGIDDYQALGYVPLDGEGQWDGTVSTALEYYLSDWALSRLAAALGKEADAHLFAERARGYLNYLDPETGFLRPKYRDGTFYPDFNPLEGKHFEPVTGFVEGTAWQYRFYTPHDVPFLIEQLGGADAFSQALQACFREGLYDVANEPDITYPYLFNYVEGEEWRSQEKVAEIIARHYSNQPGGIPGNDDTGTLSTWLAFSMMGFYPLCPADMDYALVTPAFESVRLHLNPDYYPGGTMDIQALRTSENSQFIQQMLLNGQPHNRFFITHQQLTAGGVLKIDLGDTPSKK